MPGLDAVGLLGNPSREPWRYPGPLVPGSCLLVGSWIYPLAAADGQADGQLGDWRVSVDGGPLGPAVSLTLEAALALAGAAPMADRKPVLAMGSNAAPGQLLHKLGAGTVVPLTRATVRGLGVGHSAHVSGPGYVPYTAYASAGHRQEFIVTWLDAGQRARLDVTEPNYLRVLVDAAPASLESGHVLWSYALYRSRWGLLRLTPDPAATGQEAVLAALAELAWFRRLVPECAAGPRHTARALAARRDLRVAVRDSLRRHGMVTADNLDPRHYN